MNGDATIDIERPEQFAAYLLANRLINGGETPEIVPLSGGVSNRVMLIRRPGGESWVAKQALDKLRVEADWFSSPQRIHREAAAIRYLAPLVGDDRIPALVFEDLSSHILIMRAAPEPHENWKQMLMRGEVDEGLVRQFGVLLAAVHARSRESLARVTADFADRAFFESLRIEPYYGLALEKTPKAEFLRGLILDTRTRRFTFVHGDYSPKNVLVHRGGLILIDHEVAHFGDPAFDAGFACTHLLSKANALPDFRGAFLDAARLFWRTYVETLGETDWDPDFERFCVLHTLGCLVARVDGRSPLAYLTPSARDCQREAVLAIQYEPPATMPDLIGKFAANLED